MHRVPLPYGGIQCQRLLPCGFGLLNDGAHTGQDGLRRLRSLRVHPRTRESLGKLSRYHGYGAGGKQQQRRDNGD